MRLKAVRANPMKIAKRLDSIAAPGSRWSAFEGGQANRRLYLRAAG